MPLLRSVTGQVPVLSGKDAPAFFTNQQKQIESRRIGSRTGFLFLTWGSTLQLVGTLMSGFF